MSSLTGEVNKFYKRIQRKFHLWVGGGGGGGGPRADVGQYGDFVGTLRQISALVVEEMWGLRFCPTLGENVGTSLLFNREEIRNYRLFARSMARQSR